MKLTKTDREAFVRAVMDDVPRVDYDAKAQKLATELILESYPAAIQKVYADKELRAYLKTEFVGLPGDLQTFHGPANDLNLYADERLKVIAEGSRKQYLARGALRENLASMISTCSTLKQAQERLPEFEKYLPAERGGSGLANLPAVADVVAQLTQAGWPKGQEPVAA